MATVQIHLVICMTPIEQELAPHIYGTGQRNNERGMMSF